MKGRSFFSRRRIVRALTSLRRDFGYANQYPSADQNIAIFLRDVGRYLDLPSLSIARILGSEGVAYLDRIGESHHKPSERPRYRPRRRVRHGRTHTALVHFQGVHPDQGSVS